MNTIELNLSSRNKFVDGQKDSQNDRQTDRSISIGRPLSKQGHNDMGLPG